ncbi:hypothetical protein [Photobacterium damselae]|uniref:hypothetical protein n=1 Tax=Photobacterium damselae TaxID=38293 RepID=UPI001EDE2D7B|nr:hypothetical protein [Photobacterium damselae]MCG3823018.1 hypothetical protein [Photobacterium damselae]
MRQFEIMTNSNNELSFARDGRIFESECLAHRISKNVRDCAIISAELNDVRFWLEQLKNLEAEVEFMSAEVTPEIEKYSSIARAYFTSACVTYFKFFTHSKGMASRLDPSEIYDEAQLKIHNDVKLLRHRLMAHVDKGELFSCDIYLLKDPSKQQAPSILPMLSRANHFTKEKLDLFILLVDHLRNYFDLQYKLRGQALMTEHLLGSHS